MILFFLCLISSMIKTNNLKKNNVKILTTRIFSKVLYKTNFSNKKGNQQLLGIDLLKTEIQKDLLSITVRRVEEVYMKLLEKENSKEIMQKKGRVLFIQCIRRSCEDFLTKEYGCKIKLNSETLKKSLYTKNLLKDIELLFQIPFYILIDQKDLILELK